MNRPRKHDENYKEYKEALKQEEKLLKKFLKGKIFWNSNIRGTYRKKPRPKDKLRI